MSSPASVLPTPAIEDDVSWSSIPRSMDQITREDTLSIYLIQAIQSVTSGPDSILTS
jgi:hypothetical protein